MVRGSRLLWPMWVSMVACATLTARADLAAAVSELQGSTATVMGLSPEKPATAEGPTVRTRLVGTGLFVTPSRLITSLYVVRGATEVFVDLPDGRRLPAVVVGGDRLSRVALLEIRESVGTPIRLDRLRDPQLAEEIAIVGTSYGFRGKLSKGIVNGLGRTLMDEGFPQMGAAFEISAQADPGMSGAPVFTPAGDLVGMVLISTVPEPGTTHSPLDGGGLLARNLLLPEAMPEQKRAGPSVLVANPMVLCAEGSALRHAVQSLLADGKVRWGRLGLSIGPTPVDLVAHLGLGPNHGAVVTAVGENGPAAAAGLKVADVLVSLDGTPLPDGGPLLRSVLTRPGATIRVGYVRSGKPGTASVTVGESIVGLDPPATLPPGEGGWLGALVARTSPALAIQLGLAEGRGVSVIWIAPGSPAETAGLKPGDVIVAVRGAELAKDGLERLTEAVHATRAGEKLPLRLLRSAGPTNLEPTLGTTPDRYLRFPPNFDPDVADL